MAKRKRGKLPRKKSLSRGEKAAQTSALQKRRKAQARAAPQYTDAAIARRALKRQAEADKLARSQERADKRLQAKRKKVADRIRLAMTARARVKLIRPFVEGFDADAGFDMRHARQWDGHQRRRVEAVYNKLSPLVLKPHVKVSARSPKRLAALSEFIGMEKLPKGMKAVPVVVTDPERTRIEVTDDGMVQVRHGETIERHFFIPEELEDEVSASKISRKMLRDMPAGTYFIKTGEHEAYQLPAQHDPKRPIIDSLLYRRVLAFINQYGAERVGKFFRGFRWISSLGNADKAKREGAKFLKRRAALQAARDQRRKQTYGYARRRARRSVKK